MFKRLSLLTRAARIRQRFLKDTLFRNAIYLMASTAIMSALGFIFWVFVAHLYSPTNIGLASALIAIATLISNLSLLGLNAGIIRFLARSKKPSADINAAAIVVATVTIIAAAIYALVVTRVAGDVELLEGGLHKLAFILLMSAVSLNSLTDAVFIANRKGEYHTIGYATFGITKLILPLLLIRFGSLGIFGAYILAMLASLLVSYYLMRRGCEYHLLTKPDWKLLKTMRRYTTHNYVGVVVAALPAQLMPLLIIKNLGPAAAAFFSMAWTMVNLLYVVPSAVTQSMLAESSFNTAQKRDHLKRTIRLLAAILIPAILFAVIVSPYLLSIFGPQYRQNGTLIFQILSLATIFVAITAVGITILNIERRTWGVILVQLATMIMTSVSALLLVRFGLPGIGLAFLFGNIAASITLGLLWVRYRTHRTRGSLATDPPVADILNDAYGMTNDTTSHLISTGSNTYTYLVKNAGTRYILRVYRQGLREDRDIDQEIRFMTYLSLHDIPTPQVVTTLSDRKFGSHIFNNVRWQFLLMEFVEGEQPKHYSIGLLTNMAGQQASLHIEGQRYAKAHAIYRRNEPLRFRIRQGLLRVLSPAGFSHFDYDATNLLVNRDQILCVLDFEGMRYGPLVTCVYYTLSQVYKQERDPALVKTYLASYERTRRLTFWEHVILSLSLAIRYKSVTLLALRTA